MPTAHGADDDNITGQSNHESNNVRQNNRQEIGIIFPRQQHFLGILHENERVGTR